MSVQKPSIPKGTRDFGQIEMARRNYIFDTIRSVFRAYGYQQIETPAMENLSTLLGKYGEEGDKLLFRIQNSGEKAALAPEKGLRYDLTVPFARFVVQHQNEISFPYKRFQIQPVWRADRPQKGRYREFYQCDVDVIGTRSQVNELELVQMVDAVFGKLGVRVGIHINNRKVLTGFAEIAGAPDKVVDITVAIDKLDKIGLDKVKEEMAEKGLSEQGIAVIGQILSLEGSFADKLGAMRQLFQGGSASGISSEAGLKGLEEVEELFGLIDAVGIQAPVELDLSLARGLNYYTGAIFEVKALDWEISGVGISFGADRIYDVLTGLELFPAALTQATTLLFAVMGADELKYILPIARDLRAAGVAVEVYPDAVKLRKQFEYAERKGIPFISINGSSEMEAGTVNLKNLQSGEQKAFKASALQEILNFLK